MRIIQAVAMVGYAYKSAVCAGVCGFFVLLHGASAAASLPSKVWVARWGSDTPACGALSAPCATLQQAHDHVAAGGEIVVLSAGDFGGARSRRFTITKSVSVVHDGAGEAGIYGDHDDVAITISAGADDIIALRGLVIDGRHIASEGILVRRAAAVRIEHCIIRNFAGERGGSGIAMVSASRTRLAVSHTSISNSGGSTRTGAIAVRPRGSSSGASVLLDNVVLDRNLVGITVDGTRGRGTHLVLRGSVVSRSGADGVAVRSTHRSAPLLVTVERSALVDNTGSGIDVDGPHTTVLIRDTVSTGNDTAFSIVNGAAFIGVWGKSDQPAYRPARELIPDPDADQRVSLPNGLLDP
jgi:parallel beta helix pectate lyase-like protein